MSFLDHIKASMSSRAVRPFLTFFITVLYNVMLACAVFIGTLTVHEYIVAVGPINAAIVGFWFAEKATLKRPGEDL